MNDNTHEAMRRKLLDDSARDEHVKIVQYSIGVCCLLVKDVRICKGAVAPFHAVTVCERLFRPTHLITNVDDVSRVFLTDVIFVINGREYPQTIGEIDAYEYSIKLAESMWKDFDQMVRRRMQRNGLKDFSDAAIQRFIDDNELGGPDPGRFYGSTIAPGSIVNLKGFFTNRAADDFRLTIQLNGVAMESR